MDTLTNGIDASHASFSQNADEQAALADDLKQHLAQAA